MGTGVSDNDRRSEIAERTRRGLEEDLEDLRSELIEDLEWYERRIQQVAQRAPEWTSVDPEGVVDLFEIDRWELPEEGFLGPRMVAIGAETAEEFVDKWIETDGEPPPFDERLEEFERDVGEMVAFLEALAGQTSQRADRAHRILEEWMEANLAYLDELRQNDLEALQDLVGEGALETGPDARAEEAQLWEEQRKRADELRSIWDEFHDLVDDGEVYTHSGLDDVAALVQRACEGLEGAQPALRESGIVEKLEAETVFGGPVEAPPEAGEPDDRKEEPAERPDMAETVSLDPEKVDSSSGPPTGGGSETKPVEPEGTDDERDQWLRSAPEQTDDTAPTAGVGAESEVSATTDAEVSATEPISEMAVGGDRPTRSIHSNEVSGSPTESASEPTTDAPATEDQLRSPAEENDEAIEERRETGAAPVTESPDVDGSSPEPRRDAREAVEAESAARAASVEELDDSPESFGTTCLRIRTEWRAASLLASLVAFGPPVAFLAVMVGIGAAQLAGVEGAFNPVEVWSWVEPAVGVALAWCFCTPLLLGWRPRWSGWRFRFVHEVELRDETEFEVEDGGFSLGRVSFAWDAVDAYRMRRWEAPDGDMRGWLLIVEPKYYEPVQIIAAESAPGRWESSSLPVVEPPRDAWQVDTMPVERFRAHLEAHGVEAPHSSGSSSFSVDGLSTDAPSGTSK